MIHSFKYLLVLFAGVLLSGCAGPIASFNFEGPAKPAPIAKVTFENTSKKATSYLWDFGDDKTSNEPSPTHQYTESGNYEVTLKVFNGKKFKTQTKTIHVTAPKNCTVQMITDYGTMTILLYDETPLHRDNFIKLAEDGFFDDLLFHRVINGFMVQGGDPGSRNATPGARLGTGGPGYTVPAEFVDSLVHIKGALAAARQADQINPERRSSGSQFYIVQGRTWTDEQLDGFERNQGFKYNAEDRETYKTVGGTAQLDMQYTVFGKVVEGLDVIDKIAAVRTAPGDRPVEDVKMQVKVVY
ncbi:MAG: peptidylprolyl isomerase [Bacteroidota bacterium]